MAKFAKNPPQASDLQFGHRRSENRNEENSDESYEDGTETDVAL